MRQLVMQKKYIPPKHMCNQLGHSSPSWRWFLLASSCYDVMMMFCAHLVTRDWKQSKHFSLCSTNSSIFHWKASISMCLPVPTVTDKFDKAHLSSHSLFKERESADQYHAPTGVHSTQWVGLSENHYATVISPTWEKSRPCPPEKSHTDDEMNFCSVPGFNVGPAISFLFFHEESNALPI